MMKILVTGGSGYLGIELLKQAVLDPDIEVHATWFSHSLEIPEVHSYQLDLRDSVATVKLLERIMPNCIVHTAALMGSDALQPADAPGVAEPLIVEGTGTLARWCAHSETRMVHLSTDVVFSGKHAPYDERAHPHPIHRYGMAKYKAERKIFDLRVRAAIVRTSLIYGFAPPDIRITAILDGTASRFFTDEFRNPIFVSDLASAILELAGSEYTGILNVAGPERLSRYDFAQKILEYAGIEQKLEPVLSAESGMIRPLDCTLDPYLREHILRTRVRSVGEVLSQIR
jgi:dTDP-4-dehydrorhamnose reductase